MPNSAAPIPAFRIILVTLVSLVLLLPLAGAQGAKGSDHRAANGRSGVTLDGAVERARQGGGRILSADTVSGDGRRVHVIKILTEDGRVRRMAIDADTGERVSSGASRRQR